MRSICNTPSGMPRYAAARKLKALVVRGSFGKEHFEQVVAKFHDTFEAQKAAARSIVPRLLGTPFYPQKINHIDGWPYNLV